VFTVTHRQTDATDRYFTDVDVIEEFPFVVSKMAPYYDHQPLAKRRVPMTLPSFNAEQSLYRSNRHYRSSALAGTVGGIRPSDNLPPGSYQQSCSGCNFDFQNSILHCTKCADECGNNVDTYLFPGPFGCPGDIANCNGNLSCGGCG
jgi:hypothetical protein